MNAAYRFSVGPSLDSVWSFVISTRPYYFQVFLFLVLCVIVCDRFLSSYAALISQGLLGRKSSLLFEGYFSILLGILKSVQDTKMCCKNGGIINRIQTGSVAPPGLLLKGYGDFTQG